MAASSQGFLTAIIIDIVVCIIAFLAFSVFRVLKFSQKFYAPRLFIPDLPNRPHDMPYGWGSLFSWVMPIIKYKEPDIINTAGLDTAIYLRTLSFGVELFLYISLWCLVAMLPVNLTSDYIDELMSSNNPDYKFSEFDKCSLANIRPESNKMWVHMICVYAVTIITLWLLYRYSKESVLLRIMFIANSVKGRSSHTVLVTDIPAISEATAEKLPSIKELRKSASTRPLVDKDGKAKPFGDSGRQGSERTQPAAGAANPLTSHPTGSTITTATTATPSEVGVGAPASPSPSPAPTLTSAPAPAGGPQPPTASNPPTGRPIGEGTEEGPRKGSSADAGHSAIDVASSPSDVDVALLKGRLGGQSALLPDGLRRRHKYEYDLKDESLNPLVQANRLIKAGVSPKSFVELEFKEVYPNGVEAVQMVCDQAELDPLVAEYEKLKQQLDDLIDEAEHKMSLGKEVKRGKKLIFPLALGDWGKEKYGKGLIKSVDAIDFYIARLQELDNQIANEQKLMSQVIWPSAFVTFKSRQNQACCSTSLHHHDTSTWLTSPAPDPEELLWSNLGMPLAQRSSRSVAMWAAFWAMCFFYMIPVAAVQGLIESPRTASNPVLAPLVGNPVIKVLLEGFLPGLALKIFLILVPIILVAMMKFAGAKSLSEVDMGVVSRFFVFQVIIVFFGSVITGSFFNQVTQWISNPTSVLSVLGTAIPMVSTFFCSYVAVSGLLAKPIAFIRIVGFIIYWLLSKLAGSPKAQDRLWQEQKTTLGTTVADHTITFLLGLVYSCINPIITPFCLTYFCVNLVIERYNNIYVTTREYESNGQLWPRILNQVMTALYIMQLAMLGLLGLKKFPYTPILIPVLLVTLCFHIVVLNMFSKPWRVMSLHDAALLDRFDHMAVEEAKALVVEAGAPGNEEEQENRTYVSPVFKVEKGAIDGLLSDAQRLGERLDRGEGAKKGGKKGEGKGEKGVEEGKGKGDV